MNDISNTLTSPGRTGGPAAKLGQRLQEELQRVVEAALEQLSSESAAQADKKLRQLTERLNATQRRIRRAESAEAREATLLEGAKEFCGRCFLFPVSTDTLQVGGMTVGLKEAPAMAEAVSSGETTVAAGSAGQLSSAVMDVLGGKAGAKAYLFPVFSGPKVSAVLYAESGEQALDVSALELLTALAGSGAGSGVLSSGEPSSGESFPAVSENSATQLVNISGIQMAAGPGKPVKPAPDWEELPRVEQEMHLRAQRFARGKVAELMLRKTQLVRTGRAANDLYGTLQQEIDSAREEFRQQFMAQCESMVDYYHVELVRTAARNEEIALGSSYPGRLR